MFAYGEGGMIRLGFAVRSVLQPGLGGGQQRHLSLQLAGLRDMLAHLARIGVRFYRAPLALPAGGSAALADCGGQLDQLARDLAAAELRVVVHLDHGVSLGGVNPQQAADAAARIEATAALLARLDAYRSPAAIEATMTVHIGGPAADHGSIERFAAYYLRLSTQARARLAVEHDGAGHSLGAALALHHMCGVPVIFDAYHWALHNPERLPLDLALGLALATWPVGRRAEVHLSSGRSEAHLLPARRGGRRGFCRPGPASTPTLSNPAICNDCSRQPAVCRASI
ncbi:MAG: UV damage endonuclease UvsE [Oscillochloris sp.]|nr:UV damage endonuclease UvsE [Oscillochloris sp.]